MRHAELAVVFADISGYTALVERLGDTPARVFVKEVIDGLSRVIERSGGRVIKTIGDEVMASYPSETDAGRGAVATQEFMGTLAPMEGARLLLHVGIHSGEVVVEEGDLFGDVVNTAARVTSLALGGQILVTAEAHAKMTAVGIGSRDLGLHRVKGKVDPLRVREILWEDGGGSLTRVTPRSTLGLAAGLRIEIQLGTEVAGIGAESADALTLGRDEGSSLMVPDESASRRHATIRPRQGQFFLEDHSSNGTYVRAEGVEAVRLHRDEMSLQGRGHLRLGRRFRDDGGPILRYEVSATD